MSENINILDATTIETIEQKGHKYQSDIDAAQGAINAGSALSLISSLIHASVTAILVYFVISGLRENGSAVLLIPYMLGISAVVLSWAVVYALLSIVTTNGVSAKHAVIQSSKIEKLVEQSVDQALSGNM